MLTFGPFSPILTKLESKHKTFSGLKSQNLNSKFFKIQEHFDYSNTTENCERRTVNFKIIVNATQTATLAVLLCLFILRQCFFLFLLSFSSTMQYFLHPTILPSLLLPLQQLRLLLLLYPVVIFFCFLSTCTKLSNKSFGLKGKQNQSKRNIAEATILMYYFSESDRKNEKCLL